MTRRRSRTVSRHARLRLAERFERSGSEQLEEAVRTENFEYVRRQTKRRTLCRALVEGEVVWFILDRQRKEVVTVLSEQQAIQLT